MRSERHAFFANLAQISETENLKAARIGKEGAIPRHEPMQPAHPANRLNARPQKEVVGIAEQNLDAQIFEHILRDPLHRCQRPNRHKHGSLNFTMRSDELASAGGAAGSFNLQMDRHPRILSEEGSHLNWFIRRSGIIRNLDGMQGDD